MKMIVAVAFMACVALAAAAPFSEQENQFLFQKWAEQHGKTYESAEETFSRYNIFKTNMEFIRKHNEESEHEWTMAMNEYGDLEFAEFKARKFGYAARSQDYYRGLNVADLSNVTAPDSIDWRTKGAVTPVKNQEQCGSCWAFSTTGSVEGAHAIATGKLVSLSEQELVDCSTAEGNQGCNGGLMDDAFQYIIKQGGLCTEAAYPYTATGPNTCKSSSCTEAVKISSFKDVAKENEDDLKKAASIGPVSIAIEADQQAFQFYSGGVFSAACGTQLDHGVLIVGYGTESGKDYWIVKNSWGASWGESGYILMARGTGSGNSGECGLAMQPSYPIA